MRYVTDNNFGRSTHLIYNACYLRPVKANAILKSIYCKSHDTKENI